jgi:AmiR/NasT family two-component response regulator
MEKLKVLIAEDESLIAAGLESQLQKSGYMVVGLAKDGKIAVSLTKRLKPDVVLMDINMPEMSGLEAARELLAEQIPVAIVILTGYSEVELIREASDIGVEAYLIKPVDESDLKPALELAYSNFQRKRNLVKETEVLKTTLEERKLIEHAKGILMDLKGIKEAEALSLLQKKSRDTRRKMTEVAKSIIEAAKQLN